MPTILALGATSPLAQSCLIRLAQRGYALCLSATTKERAQQARTTLIDQGLAPDMLSICALRLPETPARIAQLIDSIPDFAGMCCAVGLYAQTSTLTGDAAAEEQVLQVNFNGLVPLLQLVKTRLQMRGAGLIVVIGSVAGDKGRSSNYAYGAAKAALAAYLSGMRQELYPTVRVIELRPGLIASRMLTGRSLPSWLIAKPECVGKALTWALNCGQDIVYCPWWWRPIMTAIKLMPERYYRRFKL